MSIRVWLTGAAHSGPMSLCGRVPPRYLQVHRSDVHTSRWAVYELTDRTRDGMLVYEESTEWPYSDQFVALDGATDRAGPLTVG